MVSFYGDVVSHLGEINSLQDRQSLPNGGYANFFEAVSIEDGEDVAANAVLCGQVSIVAEARMCRLTSDL